MQTGKNIFGNEIIQWDIFLYASPALLNFYGNSEV